MKAIVDISDDPQYFITRAMEVLADSSDKIEKIEKIEMAISLLAVSIAKWENNNGGT